MPEIDPDDADRHRERDGHSSQRASQSKAATFR
jgi:hypothetical protein